MNIRFVSHGIVFLLLGTASGFGRDAEKKTSGDWERVLVSVEINRKQ